MDHGDLERGDSSLGLISDRNEDVTSDTDMDVKVRQGGGARDLSTLLSKRNLHAYGKTPSAHAGSAPATLLPDEQHGRGGSSGSSWFGSRKRDRSAEKQVIENSGYAEEADAASQLQQRPSTTDSNLCSHGPAVPLRSVSTELDQGPFEQEGGEFDSGSRAGSAMMTTSLASQPYPSVAGASANAGAGAGAGGDSLSAALAKFSQRHPEHSRSMNRNPSLRSLVNSEQHSRANSPSGRSMVLDAITAPPPTAGAESGRAGRSATLPTSSGHLLAVDTGGKKRKGRGKDRDPKKEKDGSKSPKNSIRSRTPSAFHAILSMGARASASSSRNKSKMASRSASASRLRGEEVFFDGAVDGPLLEQVSEKMEMEGMRRSKALVAARVERMVDQCQDEDKAMFFILDSCPDEGEMIILLQHLIIHGVDINAVDDSGRSALHAAVQRKYPHVAKVLLTNDGSSEITDSLGRLPVELALAERQDDMASLLISHMANSTVRSLFEPKLNDDDDEWQKQKFNYALYLTEQTEMSKTAQAVMDSMVEPTLVPDQYDFFFSVLESNVDGVTPFQEEFQLGCKTNYHRLLENEALRSHNVVRMLTHHKWNAFGETSTLKNVLSYFAFIFMLSFALISAGRQRADGFNATVIDNVTVVEHGDPRQYPDVESYFRAIFEVVVIVATLYNLYGELQEMISAAGFDYWTDKYNYVQLTTIILIMTLIPLRWTDQTSQWYVAAVTYVLVCLRTLQLISVTKVVGIYLQILIEIVKKDVSKFAIIFTIFWIMFSGSMYLVLVGTDYPEGTMTGTDLDKVADVNSYGHILLTGLRIMVQAESVVDGYEANFHWLAIVIMMFFLFALLIVILNILIAQLSDTYQEVKSNAQRTLELNWGSALRNLELTKDLADRRLRSFVELSRQTDPESLLGTWEKPVDLTEQREGERRQRFIEQQLAKQDQQLVTIRSQMRKTLQMLTQGNVSQQEMNSSMKDMVRQQLPNVMEDIVHKNTDQVIASLGGTTARSAREIEEHVQNRVIQEVMSMLESATDDVVARVGDMMTFSEPPM